jgi:hypothetical protein
VTFYRRARLYWSSGTHRDLILTQTEIIGLSTALAQKEELKSKGTTAFTLWYDSDLSEEHRKLSFIIDLDKVNGLEVDDVEYTLDALKDVNMGSFSLWKPPAVKKSKTKFKPIKKAKVKVVVKKSKVVKKIKKGNFLRDLKKVTKNYFRGEK